MEYYIIAAFIVIVALILLKVKGRKRIPSKSTTFLIGDVGSGKTSMIYYVYSFGFMVALKQK